VLVTDLRLAVHSLFWREMKRGEGRGRKGKPKISRRSYDTISRELNDYFALSRNTPDVKSKKNAGGKKEEADVKLGEKIGEDG